jgi:hypothetical protein
MRIPARNKTPQQIADEAARRELNRQWDNVSAPFERAPRKTPAGDSSEWPVERLEAEWRIVKRDIVRP